MAALWVQALPPELKNTSIGQIGLWQLKVTSIGQIGPLASIKVNPFSAPVNYDVIFHDDVI
jgi:hypothetical protein